MLLNWPKLNEAFKVKATLVLVDAVLLVVIVLFSLIELVELVVIGVVLGVVLV